MNFRAFRRHLIGSTLALLLGSSLLSASPAVAADDALQKVKERGALRIGIEGTYPPFNFQDKAGKLVGFEVDLGEALAKQLGVKAHFQPTKWDGLLAALESGRLDVIINQVTITEARQAKYNFSQPYTLSGMQAVVRKDNADQFQTPDTLKGKKVGVGLGTNYEEWLRKNIPEADVRVYEDDPTKSQDLAVGRLDAIMVDRLAALYQVAQSNNRFALGGPAFSRQTSGIPTRKGDTELLAAINKALDTLREDGTLAAISTKWFGTDITVTE
ncbi:MAG: cystine ABC transporter substrate-binding protein [Lautropia sp.]|nr:cystine ABC transporter substrate-binding protein [Lautropia sp.]